MLISGRHFFKWVTLYNSVDPSVHLQFQPGENAYRILYTDCLSTIKKGKDIPVTGLGGP
jgi:hypothetical protein